MKASFSHEIRHLPVAQREPQGPTHTHEDDWVFVMPPKERIGRPNGHRFTLPQSDSGFSQHDRFSLGTLSLRVSSDPLGTLPLVPKAPASWRNT
jgi:hypothetical protein